MNIETRFHNFSDVYTGSEPGFYQWSRGVCMQANLDLLLDWAQSNGLGEVAVEHTHTLSSAVNLLATPRKSLLQVTHPGAHLLLFLFKKLMLYILVHRCLGYR